MPAPRFHPLARLVIALLGILIAQGALVVVIQSALATAARLSHRAAQPLLMDFVNSHALLIGVLACPPMITWLYFCRRVLDRRSFVSLGLRVRRCVRDTTLGVLSGAAAIGLLFGLLYLLAGLALGHPPIISWSPEAFEASPLVTITMLTVYAGAFCVLGFMEEISFRGYGFHNLAAWLGIRGALCTQAVIFALVHIPNVLVQPVQDVSTAASVFSMSYLGSALWEIRWGLVNIALIGVFFALCYLKTGSLWFPIGFHVSWNFFQGCIFSLPVSGIDVFRLLDIKEITETQNAFLTGGAFGGEGSVLLVPIICGMIYLLWQQPDHPQALLDLALLRPDARAVPHSWPEMVTPPVAVTQEEIAEETSRYAGVKTTLRGLRNGANTISDEDNMPLSLGTIPRTNPAPPPTPEPTSVLTVNFEPVILASEPKQAPTPQPARVSPAPPVVTISEPLPIASKSAAEPPSPAKPAPVKPIPPAPPGTRKPPSPRW